MAKSPKAKINKKETVTKAYELAKRYSEIDINDISVCVSDGNKKLGAIKNVSVPPVFTCTNCGSCSVFCYAIRMFLKLGYNAEGNAWLRNLAIYMGDPDRYFLEISEAMYTTRFFRWHTSGDIINYDYFCGMIRCALENPWTECLAFTKNYDVVNRWISENGELPKNLHVLFSASPNVDMVNPYKVPECHISFEDETQNTFHGCEGTAFHCTGDCSECIAKHCGCFSLKSGDVTIINQH